MLVVMDFKMKFESMSARETMPENFGKRGMGWHGFVAIFYEWNNILKKTQRKHLYVDQILADSNKQDFICVISLLESFLLAIISNFQQAGALFPTKLFVCSDNAGCYISKTMILMIGLINAKYKDKIFIERLIHTETQDGKGPCDRHFATAMQQCIHFMKSSYRNKIRKINTPHGLGFALAWNNGIQNSIVQLVQIDRKHLLEYSNDLKPLCNKLKKYFSRAGDIEFEVPTREDKEVVTKLNSVMEREGESTSVDGWEDNGNIRLKGLVLKFSACAHSGFGEKIGFTVNFEKKTVDLCENGRREIDIYLGIVDEVGGHIDLLETNDLDIDSDCENDDCNSDNNDDNENDLNEFENEDTFDEEYEEALNDFLKESNSDRVEDSAVIYDPELDDEGDNDYRRYTPPLDKELFIPDNLLTRVNVLKCNNIPAKMIRTNMICIKARHCQKPPPPGYSKRKDALAMAVRFAASQLAAAAEESDSGTDGVVEIKLYEKANSFNLNEDKLPGPGFARRGGRGIDLFGARYISDYKEDIKELVEKGNKESSEKMQPGQMFEALANKYENRIFALPSEYEIRCFVGQVLNKKKNQDENQLNDEFINQEDRENNTASSEQNNLFDKDFVNWATGFISKDGNSTKTPKLLMKDLCECAEFSHEKKQLFQQNEKEVRKKLGALKSKVKGLALKSIL